MLKLSTINIQSFIFRPRFFFSTLADPYYILGVEKGTPFPEIKKAFYRLASEFHPDKNDSQVHMSKISAVITKEIHYH